ncbi:MAG: glycosyltransferase family 4 protein [Planctomycetota bacterium]
MRAAVQDEVRKGGWERHRTKVAHMIPMWGSVGGGENTASLVAANQSRASFEVHVILIRMSPDMPAHVLARLQEADLALYEIWGPERMERYPYNTVALFRYMLRVGSVLQSIGPDVVVHQGFGLPLVEALACRLAVPRARIVAVSRGQARRKRLSLGRKLVRKSVARLADAFVAVSQSAAQSLACDLLVPTAKIQVVYNGWDFEALRARSSPRKAQSFVVLTAARLTDHKDHRTLIEAIRLLAEMGHEDIQLLLAGDGPMRKELEARSSGLILAGRVLFLGNRTDVPELLSKADAFVLCTHREGLPGALAEAMACGLPVVATAIGPVMELVEHRKTGLLVPPQNPQAVADALAWIKENPAAAQQMGTRAREAVLRFDYRSTVRDLESLLFRLVRV